MALADDIYRIADELRAVANQGLHFDKDAYTRERYRRVLTASARLFAGLEQTSADEVLRVYEGNPAHMSPPSGVDVAAFRGDDLLLISGATTACGRCRAASSRSERHSLKPRHTNFMKKQVPR